MLLSGFVLVMEYPLCYFMVVPVIFTMARLFVFANLRLIQSASAFLCLIVVFFLHVYELVVLVIELILKESKFLRCNNVYSKAIF